MKSRRFAFIVSVLILGAVCMAGTIQAQTFIDIKTPMSPPLWALLERELLKADSRYVELWADAYLDERGYMLHTPRWGILDGPDDLFDSFRNWTLLYSLGGSKSVLDLYRKGNNGGIRQYTEYKTTDTPIAKDGAFYKEFICMSDWHHIGESFRGFHIEALTDPADETYQKRARRFAGFYMDEDPDAKNYDPVHKVIRSIWTGSRGPLLRWADPVDWVGDPVEGRFYILHSGGGMRDFMSEYEVMLAHCNEYLHSAGDHPLNLLSVLLAFNAYALAGEQKYMDWVVEYVDAWSERIDKNGGNIPSNIGLDGSIGGETDGKWYGGTYGWDFSAWSPEHQRVGHNNKFAKGMWPGFVSAYMMTGNTKYIDVLRRQIDNLYAEKKVVDGETVYPQSYGEKGEKTEKPDFKWIDGKLLTFEKKLTEPKWYNFNTNAYIPQLMDIYMLTMDRKDLERIPKTGWIAFLEGQNPDYPEQALREGFVTARKSMERIRTDSTTPDTRLPDWPMGPEETGSAPMLNQLMCGAHLHGRIYTQYARLRYFDPVRSRAGIPEDVAALVTEMNDEMTKVTLININQAESRDVIVQTGAYGEHECSRIVVDGTTYPVNKRLFHVRLEPGAGAELVVYADRFVNRPTLALPWHGDSVPMP
jgi:hypothetical protein